MKVSILPNTLDGRQVKPTEVMTSQVRGRRGSMVY